MQPKKEYDYTSKRSDYLTPASFIDKVLEENELLMFDCDVCCTLYNVPARFHYKKDALYSAPDKINDNDGLTGEWFDNNWCNPPFDMTEAFVYKALEEQQKGRTTYMLIPARTETEYWRNGIMFNGRPIRQNIDIVFLKKELCFIEPNTGLPVKMKQRQKDGSFKFVDGVCKNPLALVILRGLKNNA